MTTTSTEIETIAIVSDLIRGLRHELGNLTTVLNFDVSRLEESVSDDGFMPPGLTDLKQDLSGLTEILTRLKQYPQPSVNKALVDLVPILSNAIEDMHYQSRAQQVQIDCLLPDVPIPVLGDDDALYGVFANILKNAHEANKQTSTLRIDVHIETIGAEVLVTFGDQGPGFSDEVLENAFRPSMTTRITDGFMRGLGLGLFSAHAVLSLHGGSITLANKPYQTGALVAMRLPLASA